MVTIDDFWLTFLLATALPMLTALVTNRWATSTQKALVLLALSVISGALTSIQAAGGTFDPAVALVGIVVSFIQAVGLHYGLLRPLNITGQQGALAKVAPGGLGNSDPNKVVVPGEVVSPPAPPNP
jgi:hypothetical protein